MKVLISAYACEPNKGSEPGVGWHWVKEISKFTQAWILTRANNRDSIEEELRKDSSIKANFVFIDLPRWLSFWKHRQRGARLYYLLWQIAIYFEAKKLHKKIQFDICHHITFVNDWMPSFLAFLPVPFVWGPLGGNFPVPLKFLPNSKDKVVEILKRTMRIMLAYLDPFLFLTALKAKYIITINEGINKKHPFKLLSKSKFYSESAIALDMKDMPQISKRATKDMLEIVGVGNLIYIKAFNLVLKAFAKISENYEKIILKIIGDGPQRDTLRKIAYDLGIEKKIKFLGSIPREDALKNMVNSDIFIFPSFEGGGMVVLEAMACGLPVVCLDSGGPGLMVTNECGIKVKVNTLNKTIAELSMALGRLISDGELRKKMGDCGKKRVIEYYNWHKKSQFIQKIYKRILSNESIDRA